MRLDSARHQVWRGDTPIDLSRTEYAVLEALMREPDAVLSRFHLLEQVWGDGSESRSNVVEVYIRYLRQKIDRPFQRHSLQTIPLDIGKIPVSGSAQGEGESGPAAARYGRPTV